MPFAEICNKLDLSPMRCAGVIQRAKEQGLPVATEHDHVGVNLPKPREDVQETGISPTVGGRQRVAVISDTHFGSKYCMRGAIKDFIGHAYERGCREVLHPGDLVDGDYRHGKFEMTHMGLSRQVEDMRKNLPELPGLSYHAITGNHDFTFTEQSGVDVGQYVADCFARAGRNDFKAYGDRGAFVQIRGALIHLWHPSGGGAYAASYNLQKKIESYSSGMKPQILLTGHYHRYCHIDERGIHALLCPTFQRGGSAFSNSLKCGAPSIGGLILEWDLTAEGTMRNFSVEKRSYFHNETAHRVESVEEGIRL